MTYIKGLKNQYPQIDPDQSTLDRRVQNAIEKYCEYRPGKKEGQMFGLSREMQSRSPITTILAWYRNWAKRSSEPEMQCCGELEIERMARDIRMSASELRAIMKLGPGAADLLQQRMAALDLDPKEVTRLEPETLRDLQRVCALCKSHRRCARDFARKAKIETWNDYCPNTGTLTALSELPWAARREW